MADEEKAAAEATPAKGGSGLKWLVLVAVASLASAGGTFFVVSRSATHADGAEPQKEAAKDAEHADGGHGESAAAAAEAGHAEEASHSEGHGEASSEEHGGAGHGAAASTPTVLSLETFIVNINDGDRDRFLKLKPELELTDAALSDELKARMPQVKDIIISLLSSQSFAQIRTIEGKDLLREELMVRLNALAKSGKVTRVFFTEFVVQ